MAKHKQLAALDTTITSQPFKLMFLLRLTPLPFAMLSYALSVTQVRFWPYLGATTGILIYNASLVYMGYTTKHLAGLVSGSAKQGGVSYPLLASGVVISLLVLFYVTKIAGETINRLSSEKSSPSC
ncbi:MAG: VTT domain-containing protein [Methylococcaceae bacterium]|nr:VTT domain-containing protein [Methylococcaceae bacterium]